MVLIVREHDICAAKVFKWVSLWLVFCFLVLMMSIRYLFVFAGAVLASKPEFVIKANDFHREHEKMTTNGVYKSLERPISGLAEQALTAWTPEFLETQETAFRNRSRLKSLTVAEILEELGGAARFVTLSVPEKALKLSQWIAARKPESTVSFLGVRAALKKAEPDRLVEAVESLVRDAGIEIAEKKEGGSKVADENEVPIHVDVGHYSVPTATLQKHLAHPSKVNHHTIFPTGVRGGGSSMDIVRLLNSGRNRQD